MEQELTPDTALFSSGLLDSVSMVRLITHIEELSDSTVQPADVTLENFDTPAQIMRYAAQAL